MWVWGAQAGAALTDGLTGLITPQGALNGLNYPHTVYTVYSPCTPKSVNYPQKIISGQSHQPDYREEMEERQERVENWPDRSNLGSGMEASKLGGFIDV